MAERVVIVGGGVAGLTLAERLLARPGTAVILVEREPDVGGLARTFEYDGFTFDIGPHRFHTTDSDVQNYVLSVLGGDHILIPRKSSVYLSGRYYNWPLTLSGALRLPLRIVLPGVLDIVYRPGSRDARTFADHIISRYGRSLYRNFFRDYTRKFTGIDAGELHSDWARAGVDRAVIDRRVRADNIGSLLRGLLLPRPVSTSFVYPARGGISSFCKELLERVVRRHGMVATGAGVVGIEQSNGRVTGVRLSGGSTITADRVFWSAPLSILFPELGFSFMNTVLYNIGLQKEQGNDWQWCYFGEADIVFSRLTAPRNFREDTVPMARDSLVAEITCRSTDPVWSDPASLIPGVIESLERVGAARSADVVFVRPERVPETYPVYDLSYRERIGRAMERLPEGLSLIGRCGCFWYNNMDHSISQALRLASGKPEQSREFWLDST
ncbi:FAD-dependent oxidoreductase [Candidatus Fermentibacterales bacterium]|nr:FAD-dependent oxidoreductase [Candidatus Fermentibacterales bacterium]